MYASAFIIFLCFLFSVLHSCCRALNSNDNTTIKLSVRVFHFYIVISIVITIFLAFAIFFFVRNSIQYINKFIPCFRSNSNSLENESNEFNGFWYCFLHFIHCFRYLILIRMFFSLSSPINNSWSCWNFLYKSYNTSHAATVLEKRSEFIHRYFILE